MIANRNIPHPRFPLCARILGTDRRQNSITLGESGADSGVVLSSMHFCFESGHEVGGFSSNSTPQCIEQDSNVQV
jgi:hypothetical protein